MRVAKTVRAPIGPLGSDLLASLPNLILIALFRDPRAVAHSRARHEHTSQILYFDSHMFKRLFFRTFCPGDNLCGDEDEICADYNEDVRAVKKLMVRAMWLEFALFITFFSLALE